MFHNRRQLLLTGLGVTLSAGAPVLMWLLYRRTPCLEALPWDSANHALDGLRLSNNLKTLSLVSYFGHLLSMSHWPPMPAVLASFFFLLFGASASAAVGLSLFSLFLVFFVPFRFFVFYLFRGDIGRGLAAFLAYASFAVSAGALLRYSVYVMYELPGAMLTMLAVVCYWRALDCRQEKRESEAVRWYRRTSLATLALLLSKWNYGLQFLLVLVAIEVLIGPWHYVKRIMTRTIRPLLSPREATVLWGLFAALAAWTSVIAITGGFEGTFLGLRVRATSIANPLYALYLVGLARVCRLFWRGRLYVDDFHAIHRPLLKWLAIPYALWLLYPSPNRFKTLLYHLKYGAPEPMARLSLQRLEYYTGFIVNDFTTGSAQAWFLLAAWAGAAITALMLGRRGKLSAFFLVAYGSFAWFSSGYLTNNLEPRFILNFMPVIFLGAAWFLAGVIPWRWVGLLPAALALVLPALRFDEIRGHFGNEKALPFSDAITGVQFCLSEAPLVEAIRTELVNRVDGSRGITTVGLEDMHQLCPLLQWELHRRYPSFSRLPEPKVCDHGYNISPEEHVSRGVNSGELQWVLVFDREPSSKAAVHSENVKRLLEPLAPSDKFPVSFGGLGLQAVLYRVSGHHL